MNSRIDVFGNMCLQILYVLVRVIISHSSHTWKNWIGLVLTSLGYGIPYKLLHQMAKPSVSDAGELLDGGFDMRVKVGQKSQHIKLKGPQTQSSSL